MLKNKFFVKLVSNRNYVLTLFCLLLTATSCKNDDDHIINIEQNEASDYNSEVVIEWYNLIKTLTTNTPGYTPPVASRAFGYTGIALYEAIVKGIPNKSSMSGKLNDLQIDIPLDDSEVYHWPTVANAVLARMTKYFYVNTTKERMDAILALEQNFTDKFVAENGLDGYESSVLLAYQVADEIIDWSLTDGAKDAQFNNFPTDYILPSGPEYWAPTSPDFTPALQPYWGSNRPFITANIDDCQPLAPPVFSSQESSICYERALEVYNVVQNITSEQKIIAEFWSDDPITTATPPGHSISILNQVIKEENASLNVSVEAFAKLGIGIADAFISCWKTKYNTLYPRPIAYINSYIDPNWEPILGTPPFPEYTSGHSVQSAALAEIMTSLFGKNYYFIDRTHEGRLDIDGTPRAYNNFYELAEEAAVSRLYGGIHFQEAIYLGLDQGYLIGSNVNALNWDK